MGGKGQAGAKTPALSFTGEVCRATYFSKKSRGSKTEGRDCTTCRKFRAAWGKRMSFTGGRQRGDGKALSLMHRECHTTKPGCTTKPGFTQRGAADRLKARRGGSRFLV